MQNSAETVFTSNAIFILYKECAKKMRTFFKIEMARLVLIVEKCYAYR